ncbi:acyltransferase [Thalassococcus sp. CAU 1522]|uniref:Acyltransferase n=1 Tax=Thalassococcus arenae TaxID=2851652 RepID=A0ABS6N6B8_9RHOB|nr:acyltransferase family protein [Thalassococcus arenae]MBV2359558.1 acyltransferase [Thalassococcus arenae]
MAREATPYITADTHAPLPYRSDIDGLRAFAVLSVVLYHFGLPLRGGFVGVDIFFVISGFLIGGILWREYDQTGRIWLRHFYARRIRRLAPAYFVMALVTTAFSWLLLLPFEFREYGKSLIAATVYLSNVYFYRGAGYFDSASDEKPLLHTWSLAVEEQFYIFLPLFILFLARWRSGLLSGLVLVWVVSLGACVILTPSQPTAAFYLFPLRAWELLSGVLLAIWGYETGQRWRGADILSWSGIGLLVFSVAAIPAGPLFPGLLAILPVAGTVLLLANGAADNPVNRALCHPVSVFFGLISYSLYLWHWPIFVLSGYLQGNHGNPSWSLIWIAASVGIAWLSWRFVEQPVRRSRTLTGGIAFAGTAAATAVLLSLGAILYTQDGLPGRFGAEARTHIAASGDFLQDWSRCHVPGSGPLMGLDVCPIGPEGPPRVAIWGDSHVRAFREGLDRAAWDSGTPGITLWRAGCPPLVGVRKTESAATPAQDTACTQANTQIAQSFSRIDSLDTILLIGRWSYYATGSGTGLDAHNRIALHPLTSIPAQGTLQAEIAEQAAKDTVSALRQRFDTIAVLRQPPEIARYDSRRAAREAAHAGWPLAALPTTASSISLAGARTRAAAGDGIWADLADTGDIIWIDPWPAFCDDSACHAVIDGIGQYFDNNHVTNTAALRLKDLFAATFGQMLRQPTNAEQDDRG